MAAITGIPKPIAPEEDRVVSATPTPYKGVTVDTQFNPTDIFTTFVGGYPITVDYYPQLFSSKEGTKDYQRDLESVYQPYKLIRGLELIVNDPISRSQDTQTKEFDITGGALCYNVFRPTEGDVFIYDIGDGNEYLFHVTSSRRETENSRSVTAIEYRAIARMSEIDAFKLNDGVTETLYFDKDYMRRGFNPLLREDQVNFRNRLEDHYQILLDMFLSKFFSGNERTLLVPAQKEPTYDPFLTEFFTRVINVDEHPRVKDIIGLDVVAKQSMYTKTIWTLLETLQIGYLNHISKEAFVTSTKVWNGGPVLGSIYFSRVKQVVYLKENHSYVDAYYDNLYRLPTGVELAASVGFDSLDNPNPPVGGDDIPLYVPVTVDNNYVLSNGFYNKKPASMLEQCVLNALGGKQMDLSLLVELCNNLHELGPLEQYYYTPIILTLIRVHPRGY